MHAHGTDDVFDEHGISLVHIHECGKQNAPQALPSAGKLPAMVQTFSLIAALWVRDVREVIVVFK
jgi:hypothetical protein